METSLGADLVTSYCGLEVIMILLKIPPLLERYLSMKIVGRRSQAGVPSRSYMYTARLLRLNRLW